MAQNYSLIVVNVEQLIHTYDTPGKTGIPNNLPHTKPIHSSGTCIDVVEMNYVDGDFRDMYR